MPVKSNWWIRLEFAALLVLVLFGYAAIFGFLYRPLG
jgi:hypothetical protein